jgi:riboflavin kinase/FMN adenylyltransferase
MLHDEFEFSVRLHLYDDRLELKERHMSLQREPVHLQQIACALRGPVLHGDKRGRTIGFPTANMVVWGPEKPPYGIYASRVFLADGRVLDAVTNFGVRPTFSPPKELLETHIFDFAEDLYGQWIDVELVQHLRPEERFSDIDSLIAQMDRDCMAARVVLANKPIAINV